MSAAAEVAYWLLGTHPYLPEVNVQPRRVWGISAQYRTIFEGLWRHLRPDGRSYNGAGFLPKDLIIKIGPKIPGTDVPTFVEVKHSTWTKDNPAVSRLDFISGEGGESARQRIQGAAIDLAAVDEEIDSIIWGELKVRLLIRDGRLIVSATLVRSEDWLVDMEDRFDSGDPTIFLTRLNTEFNEHIKDEARQELFRGSTKEELEIRVQGRSKKKHGLVYNNFKSDLIIDPIPIPPEATLYAALDPGFRVFAGLWMAVFPNGKQYVIDEMYLEHISGLKEVADYYFNIKRKYAIPAVELGGSIDDPPKERVVTTLIDPAASQTLVDGSPSIQHQLIVNHNIVTIPGFNAIEAGIVTCQRAIEHKTVRVFNTCVNFNREIKRYKLTTENTARNQHDRKDGPLRKWDHLMDCWRYLMMFIPFDFRASSKDVGRTTTGFQKNARKQQEVVHPWLGSNY